MENLAKLERALGIKIIDPHLFKEALTHPSFASEHNITYHNQRLELLGDSVVQIVFTEYLFRRYPDAAEGDLTQIRSAMVNQHFLTALARRISLGDFLLLGKGELEIKGHERESTLCDAFEAISAAIYLDQGLEAARKFLIENLEALCEDPRKLLSDLNPKGSLQEYTQCNSLGVPRYDIISVSGPDHLPSYEVAVTIKDSIIATGTASSRKLAERNAARMALEILKNKKPKRGSE